MPIKHLQLPLQFLYDSIGDIEEQDKCINWRFQQRFFSPMMPPWGKTLGEEEIEALAMKLRAMCKCTGPS